MVSDAMAETVQLVDREGFALEKLLGGFVRSTQVIHLVFSWTWAPVGSWYLTDVLRFSIKGFLRVVYCRSDRLQPIILFIPFLPPPLSTSKIDPTSLNYNSGQRGS